MTVEEVGSQIEKILLDFQIGDLKKAAGPFLKAIGLMTATEFLGGLVTGTLGLRGPRTSRHRFEEGLGQLGPAYEELLTTPGAIDLYENIRCGLVHQYLPLMTQAVLSGETKGPGIVDCTGRLELRVDDYIRDLEKAAKRLICNLADDPVLFRNCVRSLQKAPRIA